MNNPEDKDEDEWMEQGRSMNKKTRDAGCIFSLLLVFVFFLLLGLIGSQWY
jgi:hypothetical protein